MSAKNRTRINENSDLIDVEALPAGVRSPVRDQRMQRELEKAFKQHIEERKKEFKPTLAWSPQEHWVNDVLEEFFRDHWITDVLFRIKPGKDATVFCCRAHPSTGRELIAAKAYRPAAFRTMRNDELYREGREMLDEDGKPIRDLRRHRALDRRTRFGRQLKSAAWTMNEFSCLHCVHAAGAAVPAPLAHSHNVILMDYIGTVGAPAPTLHEARIDPGEAELLFTRLLRDVETFLACGLVHGDLSAYNILYWQGDVTIIDLPQAVNPEINPNAEFLLHRDVTRLCQYFARYGLEYDPDEISTDLWERYLQNELQ